MTTHMHTAPAMNLQAGMFNWHSLHLAGLLPELIGPHALRSAALAGFVWEWHSLGHGRLPVHIYARTLS